VKRLLVLAASVGNACGTAPPSWAPDAGPCVEYVSTIDVMTPAMSFKTDVMPVLEASCASSSCHGIADGPKGDLFLGAQLAHGSDADTVHGSLVGKASSQLPSMQFVAPGDVKTSYVMHKLDNDQCIYNSACVGSDCQHSMPFDVMLDVSKRDIIRRWIAQGAANN
jgi:hypothetical protein